MNLWIAYQVHYGRGNQLDRDPDTFSRVAVFTDEVAGLRYANQHGLKLVPIKDGQPLEAAIHDTTRIRTEIKND